jgi:hypothetical protein
MSQQRATVAYKGLSNMLRAIRRFLSRSVFTSVAIICLWCAPAAAQNRTPLSDAVQAAEAYWNASPEGSYKLPCHSEFPLSRVAPKIDKPEILAYTEPPSCTIWLEANYFPSELADATKYAEFCHVLIHEIGHIVLGVTYFQGTNPTEPDHSTDPHNVMDREITNENEPTQCAAGATYWLNMTAAEIEAHVLAPNERQYTPSPILPIRDSLTWRGFRLQPHHTRTLYCGHHERLQRKLWIIGGPAHTTPLSSVSDRVSAGRKAISVRGACETVLPEEKVF